MSFRRIGFVLADLLANPEKLQAAAEYRAAEDEGGDRLNPAGEERDGSRPPAHDREDARMGKGKGRSTMAPASDDFGSQTVRRTALTLSAGTGKCGPAVVRRSTGSPCPAAGPHLLA